MLRGTLLSTSGNNGAIDRIIDNTQQTLEDTIINLINLGPRIVLAIALVGIAVIISQRLDPYVQSAAAYVDEKITGRFTQRAFTNTPAELVVSRIVTAFVILYAVFIASAILGFNELRRELERILFYLPDLFGGLAIILVSLGVGQIVGQRVTTGSLATDTDYATEIAIVAKASIIAIGTVVGLEMVGADLRVVYTLADGFAGAIGIGLTAVLAILIGLVAGIALRNSEFLRQNS